MMTMSQVIKEAFGEIGGALSKEAIKQSVESRYPRENGSRPRSVLTSTRARSTTRRRTFITPTQNAFSTSTLTGTFELYEEKAHGPNLWAPNEAEDVSEEAEQAIEASISLERDIEDQLDSGPCERWL